MRDEAQFWNMRKTIVICVFLMLIISGCSVSTKMSKPAGDITIIDSDGTEISVPANATAAVLYGSFADAWLLAGGNLVGTTEDAVSERNLDIPDGTEILGTVKEPNVEALIACDPDLVILSADITAQGQLKEQLAQIGIPCAYFQVDAFSDYAFMMEQFCHITGREDLYERHVSQVQRTIDNILDSIPQGEAPSVLLIRAFSSGIKAKADDNLAGIMLAELGCHNIAEDNPAMLEDLSIEEVILQDPDYIFVSTMGDEEAALSYFNTLISENPAWQDLSAVRNGRYVILPKDLFHYKPNDRWGESYEYLAKILYPNA